MSNREKCVSSNTISGTWKGPGGKIIPGRMSIYAQGSVVYLSCSAGQQGPPGWVSEESR